MAYGLLGCAIGLATGVAWKSRHLSKSVAGGAMKNIGKVRDEQWLSKNPSTTHKISQQRNPQ